MASTLQGPPLVDDDTAAPEPGAGRRRLARTVTLISVLVVLFVAVVTAVVTGGAMRVTESSSSASTDSSPRLNNGLNLNNGIAAAGAPPGAEIAVGTAAGAAAPAMGAPAMGAADAKAASTGAGTSTLPRPGQRLVRTVDLTLKVDDLAAAGDKIRAVAVAVKGQVASESTSYPGNPSPGPVPMSSSPVGGTVVADSSRPGESMLVLRVPVGELDHAVDLAKAVGTEVSRSSRAEDVTAEHADVSAQVKTQQASVDRIRALLAKATSLSDITMLESELSRRQAELDGLAARQKSLESTSDNSTLVVTLRTPDAQAGSGTKPNTFWEDLKGVRKAARASTLAVVTVLAASLPVLVTVLVLFWPLRVLLTWGRRRATAGTSTTAKVPAAATATAAPADPADPVDLAKDADGPGAPTP